VFHVKEKKTFLEIALWWLTYLIYFTYLHVPLTESVGFTGLDAVS